MSNKLKRKRNKTTTFGDYLAANLGDHLDSTRYTFDAWKRSQENSMESYKDTQHPEDFMSFAYNMCVSCDILREGNDGFAHPHKGISENFTIRPIVIDDEYYEYLKINNKEDNTQSRSEYMNTISDTNAMRLLKKNHLNWTLIPFAIPVMVASKTPFPKEMSYSLGDKRAEMTMILESVYGMGNVYVPGYICHTNYIDECEDTIVDEAYTYFFEGTRTTIGKYRIQPNNSDDANLTFYFIPFVVKHEFKSPRISLAQLIGDEPIEDAYKMFSILIDFKDIAEDDPDSFCPEIQHCRFSFKETELDKIIESAFPSTYNVKVIPYWDVLNNCAEIIEDYIDSIKTAMQVKVRTQNLLNNHSIIKK